MRRRILNPACALLAGAALGAASRWMDLHTEALGDIFSQLSVWILLGVTIAVFSGTPLRAIVNVTPFCLGMVGAYYFTARRMGYAFRSDFVYGWTAFALLSPLFACVAWRAGRGDRLSKLLSAGIVAVTLAASAVMFRGPHWYDLLIAAALAYLLFFRQRRDREK